MQRYLFFAILLLPLTARAFDVDTIKTSDGKVLYCDSYSDTGRIGYRPNLPAIVNKDGVLNLSFSVTGYRCHRPTPGHYVKDLSSMNAPTFLEADNVTQTPLETRAIFKIHERTLARTVLEDQMMQMLSVSLDLPKILSKADYRRLNEGQDVPVKIEYYHRVRFSLEGSSTSRGGVEDGGAYSFEFALSKDELGNVRGSPVVVRY